MGHCGSERVLGAELLNQGSYTLYLAAVLPKAMQVYSPSKRSPHLPIQRCIKLVDLCQLLGEIFYFAVLSADYFIVCENEYLFVRCFCELPTHDGH